MIEYIKGDIAEILSGNSDFGHSKNRMGYDINISLNTYSAIQNQSNTKLYIYEAIREDALRTLRILDQAGTGVIFFVTDFRIPGIGGNTAPYDSVGIAELCGVIQFR